MDTDRLDAAVHAVLAGSDLPVVAGSYGTSTEELSAAVTLFETAGREALVGGVDRSDVRFAGLIAHELGTPLTMIRGWTEMLREHESLPREVLLRALDGVMSQIGRLERLAADAMDATAIALGNLPLQLEPVEIGGLVRRVVTARSDLSAPDKVGMEQVVFADADRIGQVLDNLIDNAARHGPGERRIAVRAHPQRAEVVVRSGGTPLNAAEADAIFAPFAHGAHSRGLGLGLHVCRCLVHAHGGQIGVRPRAEGNDFWFTLPLALAERSVVVPLPETTDLRR